MPSILQFSITDLTSKMSLINKCCKISHGKQVVTILHQCKHFTNSFSWRKSWIATLSKSYSSAANDLQRSFGQPTSYTHPYLMKEDEVTPGLTRHDYASRRKQFMKLLNELSQLKKETARKSNVVILFGQPTIYMSEDIPYTFHQNTNFRYLTGFLEPGSVLIMQGDVGSESDHESLLLVPERDVHKELWHGPRAGVSGALALTGAERTDSIENISSILDGLISNNINLWYDHQNPVNFHLHMNYMRKFLTKVYDQKIEINSPSDTIHKLRHIKTEKEIALLVEAGQITCQSYNRAMPSCYPGMNERTLHAMIECDCKFKGAQMLAYPPVVAGGNRANTLHYITNDQRIEDGQLVLVDAGAEYHGYVADITRTWPINGKFSSAQHQVYQSVLNIQKACLEMCREGTTLDAIYSAMSLLLCHQLAQIGIIKEQPDSQNIYEISRKFCPHHVGHWLGMDVHDTGSIPRSTMLKPGMVLTVEPGIYIPENDESVPKEFRGIGVRIEDDVVITSDKPFVLTKACPKEIDDIEQLMIPQ